MSAQPPGTNPYDPSPSYPVYGAGGVPFGPPPDHPKAATVLVLGVLGLAVCQVVSPFAWAMGNRVRREIRQSGGRVGGQQIATFGWVLGIVGSCLLILGALVLVGYVAVLVAVVGTSG